MGGLSFAATLLADQSARAELPGALRLVGSPKREERSDLAGWRRDKSRVRLASGRDHPSDRSHAEKQRPWLRFLAFGRALRKCRAPKQVSRRLIFDTRDCSGS